nr:MAG TPA: hypothetical protein [Caudoviricetes sp.]
MGNKGSFGKNEVKARFGSLRHVFLKLNICLK